MIMKWKQMIESFKITSINKEYILIKWKYYLEKDLETWETWKRISDENLMKILSFIFNNKRKNSYYIKK